MSLEVWGDEGNAPSRWEDTAVRQEFDAVVFKFREWLRTNRAELPSTELERLAEGISDLMDEMQEGMSGKL